MKTWAIFKVYDYKGGELSSDYNLDYKKFINSLVDIFKIYGDVNINISEIRDLKIKGVLDETNEKELEFVINKLKNRVNADDFYSIYASNDGFCGELFEVEDGKMKEVSIDDYLEDIAKIILKQLK